MLTKNELNKEFNNNAWTIAIEGHIMSEEVTIKHRNE